MKVTVVVDNAVPINAKKPFRAEHGLSLLLETGGKKILFDAGQTDLVVHNLSLLGVNASQIDMIVLSHGHYDHAGGLMPFLQHGEKNFPLYADADIFTPRYSLAGGGRFFIGIPYAKEQLSLLGADWRLGKEPFELLPNLWYSGRIPRETSYERGDKKLVISGDGSDCTDELADDISLYYVADGNLVVIGGCTHSGLVNSVNHGMSLTGAYKLKGWIGGTHLGPVSEEQQAKTLTALANFNPEFVFAGHCTGFAMMAELARVFGPRFIPSLVGAAVQF